MSYSIITSLGASEQLSESYKYYDKVSFDAGDDFLVEVRKYFKLIIESPYLFPVYKYNLRKAVLRNFPFIIFYKINKPKSEIIILTIFHTSKKPLKFT